jgi:hypothetical protein
MARMKAGTRGGGAKRVRGGKSFAPQTQTGNHLSITKPTKVRKKYKKGPYAPIMIGEPFRGIRSTRSIPNGEPVKTFLLTPMNNFRSKIDKDLDRAFKEVRDGCGQPVLPR